MGAMTTPKLAPDPDRIIRAGMTRDNPSKMNAYLTSEELRVLLLPSAYQHPHDPFVTQLIWRFRAVIQDELEKGGFGLLHTSLLYADTHQTITDLRFTSVPCRERPDRLTIWTQSLQAIAAQLDMMGPKTASAALEAMQASPPDGDILLHARQQLIPVTVVLYRDDPIQTATRIRFIEFAADAHHAIIQQRSKTET